MKKEASIKDKKYNARLYPIYKMCSWDLLFYYAIAFVFLVQTKGFSAAQVMLTDAIYPFFKIILQLPCTTIIDKIGKRKSLILANSFLSIYILILIGSTNIGHVIFGYFIMAFSFAIKNVAESNLLYDSVTSKKGKGMFAKIEEIGARNYYYLDGISSLFTGLLFVVNGYIPMIISLAFTVIATAISTCFKEVYKIQEETVKTLKQRIIEYRGQLATAFKFIFKSKRLQAIMAFVLVFDGLVYTSYTLRESLLTELNVSPEFFAVIISTLTVISGFTASLQKSIHKNLKNKALTFLSLLYTSTFLIIGIFTMLNLNYFLGLAVILVVYAIQYAIQSPYHTLKSKYLKSFASAEMRIKISATFDLIMSVSQCIIAFIASCLLDNTTVSNSFILIGFAYIFIMIVVLVWMKPRFGLQPEEYSKNDIEYEEV